MYNKTERPVRHRYDTSRTNENQEYGIIVRTRSGENFESLLRRFKKKVSKDGIIQEVRKRVAYEKPSVKKNRKRREAEQKRKQAEDKKNQFGGVQ